VRQVEVQEHGHAVAGDQDVRRLDVAVQDPPVVRVLQRLGQAGAPPGDRPGERPGPQGHPPGRPTHPVPLGRTEPVQGRDQRGPRRGAGVLEARLGQDLGQRDPAEVGHAQQVQPRGRVDPVRVDRDDVRMLQPRQRLRLARADPRHLQCDGPVRQLPLLRQEDPGERAAAQLLDEPEAGDRLAGLGQGDGRRRRPAQGRARALRHQAVDVEDLAQARGDLGEPGLVVGRVGMLAGLLAEAELLVGHATRVSSPRSG
jgi:hypothetical protein